MKREQTLIENKWFWRIVVPLVLILIGFPILLLNADHRDDYVGITRNGEEMRPGTYTRYEGKIYASVPSNGYYELEGADPASFSAINDRYADGHVARDRAHVYCGNRVMPDVNPATIRSLGNNYYSDGALTYFCSPGTVNNDDLSELGWLGQQLSYGYLGGAKPQTYLYPMVDLPKAASPYRALLDHYFATDWTRVYFKGVPLPKANPATFRRIGVQKNGRERGSEHYFADGKHVYFNDQLMNIPDHAGLVSFEVGQLFQQFYLADARSGMMYINGKGFDPAKAPYRLVSASGDHGSHALFSGADGLYFYNSEEERVERAGDDPFASGGYTMMSPTVFTNGREILFLRTDKERERARRGYRTIAYLTTVARLDEGQSGQWKKIGVAPRTIGAVWQNGNAYYYFDELGESQLIYSPIYRVVDKAAVKALLDPDVRTDDVRNLVRSGALVVPAYTKVVAARTQTRASTKYFMSGLIAFVIAINIFLYFARRHAKKAGSTIPGWFNLGRFGEGEKSVDKVSTDKKTKTRNRAR